MAVLNSYRSLNTKEEARQLADSIPRHQLPRLLFLYTHGSKYSIHKKLKEFVREQARYPISPVRVGRIAKELAKIWKIRKNKRRNNNELSVD